MPVPKKQLSKAQKQELIVSYQLASAEPEEIARRVDQAFDVLFEAMQKEIESNQKIS